MSTRAMGMAFSDIGLPRPPIELTSADWSDYIRDLEALDVPPGLLGGVNPSAFHVLVGGSKATRLPPDSRSTSATTAASTTSRPSSARGGADSGPR